MVRSLPSVIPRNPRLWVLFAVLIAVMQFSDPLGQVSLGDSMLFWCGRLAGVAISLVLAEWIVSQQLSTQLYSPVWLKPAVLSMLIAALPMTLVEFALESVIPQNAAYDDSALRAKAPLLAALSEYLTVLSVILPINVLLWFVIDRRSTDENPAAGHALPEFLRKARDISAQDVFALSAEGHYVNVMTARGTELIYCRFRDAVKEMPTSIGCQVHRSWWVADAAVVDAVRGKRRYQLELRNGQSIPVSDRYLPSLRARGMVGAKKT